MEPSLTQRLRALTAPDAGRWKPMLAGLAISAASAAAAVHFKAFAPVSLAMTVVSFAAWCAGACAMIGFVRWIYAGEVERTKRMGARDDEK